MRKNRPVISNLKGIKSSHLTITLHSCFITLSPCSSRIVMNNSIILIIVAMSLIEIFKDQYSSSVSSAASFILARSATGASLDGLKTGASALRVALGVAVVLSQDSSIG